MVLAIGGIFFVALSALFSLDVYTSGDPSGLQYIGLLPAAGFAGFAIALGCLLSFLWLRCPKAWINPAFAAVALQVASLPEATWLCYTGANLDWLGTLLAAGLLSLAPVVTIVMVRGLGPLAS